MPSGAWSCPCKSAAFGREKRRNSAESLERSCHPCYGQVATVSFSQNRRRCCTLCRKPTLPCGPCGRLVCALCSLFVGLRKHGLCPGHTTAGLGATARPVGCDMHLRPCAHLSCVHGACGAGLCGSAPLWPPGPTLAFGCITLGRSEHHFTAMPAIQAAVGGGLPVPLSRLVLFLAEASVLWLGCAELHRNPNLRMPLVLGGSRFCPQRPLEGTMWAPVSAELMWKHKLLCC